MHRVLMSPIVCSSQICCLLLCSSLATTANAASVTSSNDSTCQLTCANPVMPSMATAIEAGESCEWHAARLQGSCLSEANSSTKQNTRQSHAYSGRKAQAVCTAGSTFLVPSSHHTGSRLGDEISTHDSSNAAAAPQASDSPVHDEYAHHALAVAHCATSAVVHTLMSAVMTALVLLAIHVGILVVVYHVLMYAVMSCLTMVLENRSIILEALFSVEHTMNAIHAKNAEPPASSGIHHSASLARQRVQLAQQVAWHGRGIPVTGPTDPTSS